MSYASPDARSRHYQLRFLDIQGLGHRTSTHDTVLPRVGEATSVRDELQQIPDPMDAVKDEDGTHGVVASSAAVSAEAADALLPTEEYVLSASGSGSKSPLQSSSTKRSLRLTTNLSCRWPNTLLSPVPSPVTVISPNAVRPQSKPAEITWRAARPLPLPPITVEAPSAPMNHFSWRSRVSPSTPVFKSLGGTSISGLGSDQTPAASASHAFPTWRNRIHKEAPSPPLPSVHFPSSSQASEEGSWRSRPRVRQLPQTWPLPRQPRSAVQHVHRTESLSPEAGIVPEPDISAENGSPDVTSSKLDDHLWSQSPRSDATPDPTDRSDNKYLSNNYEGSDSDAITRLASNSSAEADNGHSGSEAASDHGMDYEDITDRASDSSGSSMESPHGMMQVDELLNIVHRARWGDITIASANTKTVALHDSELAAPAAPIPSPRLRAHPTSRSNTPSPLNLEAQQDDFETHSPSISPPISLVPLPAVSPLEGTPVDPLTRVNNRFSTAFSDPFPAFGDPFVVITESPEEMQAMLKVSGKDSCDQACHPDAATVHIESMSETHTTQQPELPTPAPVSQYRRIPSRPAIRVIIDENLTKKRRVVPRRRLNLFDSTSSSKSVSSLSTSPLTDHVTQPAYDGGMEVELVKSEPDYGRYTNLHVEAYNEGDDPLDTPSSLQRSSPISAGSVSGFKSCVSSDAERIEFDLPPTERRIQVTSGFLEWGVASDAEEGSPQDGNYINPRDSDSDTADTDITSTSGTDSESRSPSESGYELNMEDEKAFGDSILAEPPLSAIQKMSASNSPVVLRPSPGMEGSVDTGAFLSTENNLRASSPPTFSPVKVHKYSDLPSPPDLFVQSPSPSSPVAVSNALLSPRVSSPQNSSQRLSLHCRICQLDCCVDPAATMGCGHIFCYLCIAEAVIENRRCPVCSTPTLLYCLLRLDLSP